MPNERLIRTVAASFGLAHIRGPYGQSTQVAWPPLNYVHFS